MEQYTSTPADLASRNLCIAALLMVLIVMRKTRALSNLLVLTAFIQLADANFWTPWRAAGPSFLASFCLACCSSSRRRGSVVTLSGRQKRGVELCRTTQLFQRNA